MSRNRRKSKRPRYLGSLPGAAPGSLIVDPSASRPVVRVTAYNPHDSIEQQIDGPERIRSFLDEWPVVWINVDGLGDAALVEAIGAIFGLHSLALEDVVNTRQRAKVERYDTYDFIVIRTAALAESLETEQLSIFLGKNYVLTFQERAGDSFDPLRERIRRTGSRVRNSGPDYLAYALLDASVDGYFPVLESFGDRLEDLEDEVIMRPEKRSISKIHGIRRDLLTLRRTVWPLREAVGTLTREVTPFFQPETRIYLRDCHDHTVQILDLLENSRDIVTSLTDVYLSSASNRLNEIIKFLTIFTTIFIPMSFIAGLYGMNFDRSISPWNMPELSWHYGYFYALGIMALIAASMMIFFRKKGWIGGGGVGGKRIPPEEDSE